MASGVQTTSSVAGTEYVNIDAGGAVFLQTTTRAISNLASNFQNSFTTSAQANSTSITLSSTFTALTFTQTSTGNTVNLPASPSDKQICGFSITNNVTNLTVSSAANTVKNGAATDTTSAGGTFWWIFNNADTSWYRYAGNPLSK